MAAYGGWQRTFFQARGSGSARPVEKISDVSAAEWRKFILALVRELLIYGGKEKRKAKGMFGYATSDYMC